MKIHPIIEVDVYKEVVECHHEEEVELIPILVIAVFPHVTVLVQEIVKNMKKIMVY